MISQDRVILMTKMAAQAGRLHRDGERVNHYHRGDYVGFEIVKSVIAATLLYAVLLGMYAIFNFDALLQDFYNGAGLEEIHRYIVLYVLLVAVYVIVSYIVFSIRYTRGRKRARAYYNNLKKLDKYYRRRR